MVAQALEGSPSLQTVDLKMTRLAPPADIHRVLELVESCPQLQHIHLALSILSKPFWKQNQQLQHAAYSIKLLEARRRLHRLNLFGTKLLSKDGKDDVPHALLSSHDEDIQNLLYQYPALGELVPADTKTASRAHRPTCILSLRTTQLMAWNYAGRGCLITQPVPSALWCRVLHRVDKAVYIASFFLANEEESNQEQGHLPGLAQRLDQSCRASVLFSLLQGDPAQVTREACQHSSNDESRLQTQQ
jgi:hypothetical protein